MFAVQLYRLWGKVGKSFKLLSRQHETICRQRSHVGLNRATHPARTARRIASCRLPHHDGRVIDATHETVRRPAAQLSDRDPRPEANQGVFTQSRARLGRLRGEYGATVGPLPRLPSRPLVCQGLQSHQVVGREWCSPLTPLRTPPVVFNAHSSTGHADTSATNARSIQAIFSCCSIKPVRKSLVPAS